MHYLPCFDAVTNEVTWDTRKHLIPLPGGFSYRAKVRDTCRYCRDPIYPGDLAQKVTMDAPI